MRVLFLVACCSSLLAWCSIATSAEPWVITDHAENRQQSPDIDVTTFVYPIRSSDAAGTGEGGCVSIGNGTFQTVAHVFYPYVNGGFQKRATGATGDCEIRVGTTWRKARFRIIDSSDGGDVAVAQISGEVPGAMRRNAKYGERVVVYGLKTGYLQCGMVSGSREVSLDANEKGTLNGDSGGGVFSDAGEFIGTIQGGDKAEPRVVKFRPNNFEVTFSAVSKSPAMPAATTSTPGMVCENGVCRMQAPSIQGQQPAQKSYKLKTGLFGRQYWVLE